MGVAAFIVHGGDPLDEKELALFYFFSFLQTDLCSSRFRKSTDNINYSNISGASGTSTNPASGSSNTNDTYTLTQSNLTANATNYFVYVSTATNSTYGTSAESTSYSTSFEMPRDITDLTATSASSSSISLTWTASLYAGRQMVEYKASSASTWTTSGNGGN